jgi:NADP-dependent aldehyde dehydrogenase
MRRNSGINIFSQLCSSIKDMKTTYQDATPAEVDQAMKQSWEAWQVFRKKNAEERAQFMRAIADEMQEDAAALIRLAGEETNLPEARLTGEFQRTLFQLRSYADACAEGSWQDIRIDLPATMPGRKQSTAKTDIRKMQVPLGPVVVFGASNFPFAYSTAGGDTACALAAGCSVVIKAHPAHAGTSEQVAMAISRAAKKSALPPSVVIHLHGASAAVGSALVKHELTRAVGFTGSFEGGKALFDLANARPIPIPVFAEMGSVNPVFILPGKLKEDSAGIAGMYAVSITQSSGQFCTNPGILVAIEDESLLLFKKELSDRIRATQPETMLHTGIASSFYKKRENALAEEGVEVLAVAEKKANENQGMPTLAEVSAERFLQHPLLHQEVFGPYSILIRCRDVEEMKKTALSLEGQLTATLMATVSEAKEQGALIDIIKDRCGRFIMNGVPTGVEVALAMQHGGPYPATTDSRFTSVGADGIRRFSRPLCFQNWNDELLPAELKNDNPLGIWRTINNELTKDKISLP